MALAWVMTGGMRPHKEASQRVPIPLASALGCAVLVLFAVNTIERNRDWSDIVVLLEKTVDRSPANARAHRYLAGVMWRKGRYAKAEPLYKRVLAIREKALGPDHRYVATPLSNLAVLYLQKGKYAKAEPLFKRALAIQEKTLGPDHPLVAQSLNNLAALYQVQGQYSKAESLYKWSLSILEKTEPNHPMVATTMEKLAGLYKKMGREDEAKKLLDRAQRIRASQ